MVSASAASASSRARARSASMAAQYPGPIANDPIRASACDQAGGDVASSHPGSDAPRTLLACLGARRRARPPATAAGRRSRTPAPRPRRRSASRTARPPRRRPSRAPRARAPRTRHPGDHRTHAAADHGPAGTAARLRRPGGADLGGRARRRSPAGARRQLHDHRLPARAVVADLGRGGADAEAGPDRAAADRGRRALGSIWTVHSYGAGRDGLRRAGAGAGRAPPRLLRPTPAARAPSPRRRSPSPCRRRRTCSTRRRRRRAAAARCTSVTIMRAPVHATGWPRLQPLPFTLVIVVVDAEDPGARDAHRRERLVDLEHVDVADGHARRGRAPSGSRRSGRGPCPAAGAPTTPTT